MAGVNTNIMSITAQRNLSTNSSNLATTMNRLSSGLRVNSAKDDAAGLAIAEKMQAQVRGMNQAVRNANDGISFAQTAEGALSNIGDSLQRMRELAVQSANGTNSSTDRTALSKEFKALSDEIVRVTANTTFNGTKIFATASGTKMTITFQVGAGTSTNDQIKIAGGSGSGALKVTAMKISGTTGSTAIAALKSLDSALRIVAGDRATFGAVQNRFEAVISNLQIGSENQAAARSRIMDTDYAQETANLSRSQVLQQASQAMLAQANQAPQSVLQLLR